MTDLRALLASCAVDHVQATVREFYDPAAVAHALGSDEVFGPQDPYTVESRCWAALPDRFREELSGGMVIVQNGERWRRWNPDDAGDGATPTTVALTLRAYIRPTALTDLLECTVTGADTVVYVRATPKQPGDPRLAAFGQGAEVVELAVDRVLGCIVSARGLRAGGVLRSGELVAPSFEPLAAALFQL